MTISLIEDAASLSNNKYSLKVSFVTSATINFCADYGEYLKVTKDEFRSVVMDSMNGDGFCDLSEFVDLKFKGTIEIDLTEDLRLDTVKVHTEYLGSHNNPIKLKINLADIL